MELSVEEKWKRSRAALSMLLGTSIKAISESYGKGGLEKVAKAWEENNKKAANTTTLNSFKKNCKGPITGLELGFERWFNFAEIQNQLKTLSFHF